VKQSALSVSRLKYVQLACGALAAILACTVLLTGWSIHAHAYPIRVQSALNLLLCGVALLLFSRRRQWLAVVAAGLIGSLALLAVVDYFVVADLSIDHLLQIADLPVKGSGPVVPVTAACFLFISVALLLVTGKTVSPRRSAFSALLGSVVAAVGLVTCLGYLLGLTQTFPSGNVTRVSFPTTLGLIVIGLGIVTLAWRCQNAERTALRWLTVGAGLVGATFALGLWQAIAVTARFNLPFFSAALLGACIFMAILLFVMMRVARREWRQAGQLELANRLLSEKNIELERANQAKDRFLNSMSHELRTPLNAILGFTGTLLMGLPGPLNAEQTKQLQTVQRSSKHLLSLINDLLHLAKIESGEVALTLEPVVCQSVLEEVRTTLRPLAEEKGLGFRIKAPDDAVLLNTDRRAVRDILINLTSNAIKFTEQGEVRIELQQQADHEEPAVQISVCDTGVGIPPEDTSKLFQAFAQIDGHQRREKGTGLGLHLSRKLAELIQGRISFKSELGKGSTFTLLLPEKRAAVPQGEVAVQQAARRSPGGGEADMKLEAGHSRLQREGVD